jgi:hypothetical protein
MPIDRYTKVVLTIIAACLIWLSLGGPALLPTAHAQSNKPTTNVLIAGWVDSTGGVHSVKSPPTGEWGGVPVAVVYQR